MEHSSEYTATVNEFIDVLNQLIQVVHALTQIEEQKALAAAQSQHILMNDFLNPEQAQILKLRGLEQKRIRLADRLGWKGLTFRQILNQPECGHKELLSPLFVELETGIRHLTGAKDSADRAIKLRLRELESAIAQGAGGVYDGKGAPAGGSPVHFHDKYV